MHTAMIRLPMGDTETADVLGKAVAVEASDGPEGTTTSVSQDGEHVCVEVTAANVSDLRAAVNGILRLLDAAQRSIQ